MYIAETILFLSAVSNRLKYGSLYTSTVLID